MSSFKDNQGREWTLEINVFTLKRVKQALKADLIGMVEEGLRPLYEDPALLVDVLYVLCKEQADRHKPRVADEDFGRAMAGDAVRDASEALTEAIIDFFPSDRRGPLRRQMAIRDSFQAKAMERLERELDDMERMSLDELLAKSNGRSGGAPASAESTPAPSA